MTAMTIDEQLSYLGKGTVEVIRETELRAKLEKSAQTGKPLRVKLGADPTAPDIHLGHTVVIRKLRAFQELGHIAIFLIGDFTGLIGDPSGKSATRPQLTRDEINANAETYKQQIFKLLDPEKTVIDFNSRWMDTLGSAGFLRLASHVTVRQILDRDDFQQRLAENRPLALHEVMYPLVMAYDSVALEADVELGGTDQKFNLLMGRELQKHEGQAPQCVLMMPLLEGLDGVNKMSKSLGNYIGIAEPAREIFGKIMSISDDLMWRYYELLSFRSSTEIAALRRDVEGGRNPRDIKVLLAQELVARFHDQRSAEDALSEFEARFQRGVLPDDMPEVNVLVGEAGLPVFQVIKQAGLTGTTSEAMRMIDQGAVRLNGERVEDKALILKAGQKAILQVGKRKFAAVRLD